MKLNDDLTITAKVGEWLRAYMVVGRVNGHSHGNSLWSILAEQLDDSKQSMYREFEEKLKVGPKFIMYYPEQPHIETMFLSRQDRIEVLKYLQIEVEELEAQLEAKRRQIKDLED